MKKIVIKTHLHSGISGGGESRVVAEWNHGPLNLLKASKDLDERIASNKRSYGSIGCGRSWIEIDGTAINDDELPATLADAKQLIDDVHTGRIHKTRAAIQKMHDEYMDKFYQSLSETE